jgi:hypothetical protein
MLWSGGLHSRLLSGESACPSGPEGDIVSLNLRQFEVFRAVMIAGSINGAARLLSVSQPAISRLIGYMEQRVGLRLFERGRGWLRPRGEISLP